MLQSTIYANANGLYLESIEIKEISIDGCEITDSKAFVYQPRLSFVSNLEKRRIRMFPLSGRPEVVPINKKCFGPIMLFANKDNVAKQLECTVEIKLRIKEPKP